MAAGGSSSGQEEKGGLENGGSLEVELVERVTRSRERVRTRTTWQ